MITILAYGFGQDPHDRPHPSHRVRVDPERYFADDGDALHAHYTNFTEAESAVTPLWLGSHPDVTLVLTLIDSRTAARRDLTFSGPAATATCAMP